MDNVSRIPATDPAKLSYTIPEVVRATGLSRSSIYIHIQRGLLRARKCGARTVILDSELRRFLRRLPQWLPAKREASA
jgi:predicted DNA-binding transcriptional regulator AlpA